MEPSWFERALVDAFVGSLFIRDRKGGPWPAPEGARAVTIPSLGGVHLQGFWMPHERPRGAVVLAHPDRRYGKHWFTREGWVTFLHRHGYEVLAFDLPGYGGARGPPTYPHRHVEHAARFARWWAGGLPVHVVGLSMGAFAAANAAPRMPFVESLVLESPYPSFNAWYGKGAGKAAMEIFDRLVPHQGRQLKADANLARTEAKRVLVALAEEDEVTRPALSEAVARAAPAERTRLLRVPGAKHLEPFAASPAYRDAILATLEGKTP